MIGIGLVVTLAIVAYLLRTKSPESATPQAPRPPSKTDPPQEAPQPEEVAKPEEAAKPERAPPTPATEPDPTPDLIAPAESPTDPGEVGEAVPPLDPAHSDFTALAVDKPVPSLLMVRVAKRLRPTDGGGSMEALAGSPPEGPLLDSLIAEASHIDWPAYLAYLAQLVTTRQEIYDHIHLTLADGVWTLEFGSVDPVHPHIAAAPEPFDEKEAKKRIRAHRAGPLDPTEEVLLVVGRPGARLWLRRWDCECFTSLEDFMMQAAFYKRRRKAVDFFGEIRSHQQLSPGWAFELFKDLDQMPWSQTGGLVRGAFLADDSGEMVMLGSIEWFGAYPTGFVAGRFVFDDEKLGRELRKRLT